MMLKAFPLGGEDLSSDINWEKVAAQPTNEGRK